jgi:hypothetical protein
MFAFLLFNEWLDSSGEQLLSCSKLLSGERVPAKLAQSHNDEQQREQNQRRQTRP